MAEANDFGIVAINRGIISNPATPMGGKKYSDL
jgi:hypothetical protein